jgi:hypothetical protein
VVKLLGGRAAAAVIGLFMLGIGQIFQSHRKLTVIFDDEDIEHLRPSRTPYRKFPPENP